MGTTAVQTADRSGGPGECVYDVDRLYATLNQGREVVPGCPEEWDVKPAFKDKVTATEFAPIMAKLDEMRAAGGPDNNYIARQAYLSSWLLAESVWPVACHYGAAYLTIWMGMHDHGFRLRQRSPEASLVASPDHLFLLYRTFAELRDLLQAAYEPTSSIQSAGRGVASVVSSVGRP
jgi:hypothetical protein